jgi:hypothetical protein
MFPRNHRTPSATVALAFFALFVLGPKAAQAERPPSVALLPDQTSVFISVIDAPDLAERFKNTALGKMGQDPQLKPLVDHFYGAAARAVDSVQERIGLSLDEFLAIPQGELTFAVVTPEEQPPEMVVLLDAGDQIRSVRELLKRGTEALERSGADRSEETIQGTKVVFYKAVGPRRRTAAYFEKDNTVVIGSNLEVLRELLSVWNGEERPILGKNTNFAAIMRRCGGGKDHPPQVMAYVDPIGLMRSIGQQQAGVQVTVSLLPVLGLDGLRAVGGTLTLAEAPFDSLVQAHVLMDYPRDGILEMIALKSGDFEPEPWVPPDVSSYTTVHWDLQSTFDTLRTLIDGFRGTGAVDGFLKRRIEEQIGLNFEKDLLPLLSGRMTHLNWIERPVSIRSQSTLIAFGLEDTEAGGKVVEKILSDNERSLSRRFFGGKSYLRFGPPGDTNEDDGPRRQRPCLGILDESLVLTDRESVYREAISTLAGTSESLGGTPDFQAVAAKVFRKSGSTKPAMIGFRQPKEGLRLLYELAVGERTREGLRRRAENNAFLGTVNAALEANPLPPYAVIEQYLAPAGVMVVDDQTGIHYIAFGLQSDTEE